MRKLILLIICISFYQFASAQSEKADIKGAIKISNNDSQNPVEGTIRWTGQDFEGFDGTEWRSLTCCVDGESSDVILSCPSNFVLDNCSLTVNWTHDNPLSSTVNYNLRLNGVDLGNSVGYPMTSNTIDICDVLNITTGTGTIDVELLYWYDGDFTTTETAGSCTLSYDLDSPVSGDGNWNEAIASQAYDESLPHSGIFVGAANPGYYGAANTSIGRHQTIRFRAEKTGSITAVTIQNRILHARNVHSRATPGSVYQACLDEFEARGNPILNVYNVTENKKANKCGYMLGGSYSAGNGGALIFQIRNDVNGEPDMANPPLAQTATPHIPVEYIQSDDNGDTLFPEHVLSSPANVTAGVFYHITVFNTSPVVGNFTNLSAAEAYDMPDNTGAFALNGIQYAVSPTPPAQGGPYEQGPFYEGHYTMKSNAMDASTWEEDENTYGWYAVRYNTGEWSGLTAAAWDSPSTGHQIIEGSQIARQEFTATHNTTVDGIWVQHGHTTSANGQAMTITLKQASNSLGSALIPHDAAVKDIVVNAYNAWTLGGSIWSYAPLGNDVNLTQGTTYFIEASAPTGAGFRLNSMGNTYAWSFAPKLQNIPLNTRIQKSDDSGSTWVNFGGSFANDRHLQMVLTVKGMPRSLTE